MSIYAKHSMFGLIIITIIKITIIMIIIENKGKHQTKCKSEIKWMKCSNLKFCKLKISLEEKEWLFRKQN